MYKILMLNKEKAYLPEIHAYKKYFNGRTEFVFYDSLELGEGYCIDDFDIIWSFMGIDRLNHEKIRVHDYASLSTGKNAKLKNFIKKTINKKPNLRMFLNESVKNEMGFEDNVSSCLRDMGVDETFFNYRYSEKEYDFVYVGEINRNRNCKIFLDKFTKEFNEKSLVLIGDASKEYHNYYSKFKNITFTGRVDAKEVPKIASKAQYGINYIPNKYPFNIQTSTKLLEYCAMNLKIVTNSYQWVKKFETEYNGKFYYTNEIFDMNINGIERFGFKTPIVEKLKWNLELEKSGIEESLKYLVTP